MKLFASTFAVGACVLVVFACSSIPDVRYDDGGAAASTSGTSGQATSGGSTSSGNATSGSTSSGSTAYRCPDNPPPADKGICCDDKVCLRCTQSHCNRCRQEGCDGSEVCCRNGNSSTSVDCKRQTSCN